MSETFIRMGLWCFLFCAGADAGYRTEKLDIELPRKRFRHVAAQLGDGSVAVLAGFAVKKSRNVLLISPDLSQVEALDVEGGWSGYDLAGIGLPDGNVLLIDGGREVVYDYRSRTIKYVKNELPYRYIRWATLTKLSSGCILVTGGDTDDFKPIETWAVYDPAANRFISSGTMAKARSKHAAVELKKGLVLVVGSGDKTAEVLDVNTGEATLLDASPIFDRDRTHAIQLESGRVLLAGGGTEHCEIFDPETQTFSETASLGLSRREPRLWRHGDEVLVVGGIEDCRVIEIYDENTGRFRMNEALLVDPRSSGFTLTAFDEDRALVIGGRANSGEQKFNSIEKITYVNSGISRESTEPILCEGAPSAVVLVYEEEQVKRALPLSGLSSGKDGSWCYKNMRSPQMFLEKGLADCREARLEVSFSPAFPYEERVKLMHMIGLQDVGSICLDTDLAMPDIRYWRSIEDPEQLLPTEAEIEAAKKFEPLPAPLTYSVHAYDPKGDPYADLQKSMDSASCEGKHILLQAGGDWCGWCGALTKFFESNVAVSHVLSKNYVIQKVNVSTENRNEQFLSRFPKIGGFPHLFVLDAEGRLLHSQGTGSLEDGGSYNEGVVLEFLQKWMPQDEQ